MLRVDHSALVRGRTVPGEVCDLNGLHPLPIEALRAQGAGARLVVVVTGGDKDPDGLVGVAHFGSWFTRRVTDADWLLRGPRTPGRAVLAANGLTLLVRVWAEVLPERPGPEDSSFLAEVARRVTAEHLRTEQRGCNRSQKAVLDWLQPTCAVAGCNRTAATAEEDHRIDWVRCRVTDVAFIDRLCSFHHRQKTHHGYRLAPGTGRRRFGPGPATSAAGSNLGADAVHRSERGGPVPRPDRSNRGRPGRPRPAAADDAARPP